MQCALHALAALALLQIASACKNCVMLGKEERAMFRVHGASCARGAGGEGEVAALLGAGEVRDTPAMRRTVYCVLRACKLIAKDGKLLKSALRGKLANRLDGRNTTKVVESCGAQARAGATPEDVAWELFRCALDRKAALFEHMPPPTQH